MQYLLMEYVVEEGWHQLAPSEQREWIGAVKAYIEAMSKAGVLKGMNGLQPTATATTVRTTNGKIQVLDGPYAEAKEQFAGYYLIEADDLDAAIAWASRSPTAIHGVVEVRPVANHALSAELAAAARRS